MTKKKQLQIQKMLIKPDFCPICKSDSIYEYVKLKPAAIFCCNQCKNAWTYPAPIPPKYSKLDFHKTATKETTSDLKSVDSLPTNWKRSIQMQSNLIINHVKKGSTVLEIGCGEGFFLEKLKNEGYLVTGIEPSESASKRARLRNINVITTVFQPNKIKKKYDLIIMSHVLEHIAKPIDTLKEVKFLLTKNGKILLIQTNYQGLIPRIYKKSWYAWVPEQHFWHFTPKGMKYISKLIEMKPILIEKSNLCHPGITQKLIELIPASMDQFHILLSK